MRKLSLLAGTILVVFTLSTSPALTQDDSRYNPAEDPPRDNGKYTDNSIPSVEGFYDGDGFSPSFDDPSSGAPQSSHSEPTDDLAEVTLEGNEVTISQQGVGVVVPYNQFAAVVQGFVDTGNEDNLREGAMNIASDAGVPDQAELILSGLVQTSYDVVTAEEETVVEEKTDPMAGESLTDEELAEYGVESTQAQEDTVVEDTVDEQVALQSERENESASVPVTGWSIAVAVTAILVAILLGGLLFRKLSR